MSWHFAFTAATRAEAKAKAEEVQKSPIGQKVPERVFAACDLLLDGMPEEPSRPICVTSYGHVDDHNGTMLLEVRLAPTA